MTARKTSPVPQTLKRINMRRFLEYFRDAPRMSRADLTRVTGVSSATSSSIIAELLEMGVLEAVGESSQTSGRPATLYQLATKSAFCIGIALGVETTWVAATGLDGVIGEDHLRHFSTPRSYVALLDSLRGEVQSLRESRTGRCIGIGLCAPGLIDEENGKSVYCPAMPQIQSQKLKAELETTHHVPVVITQENHGLCLAEQRFGNEEGALDFVLVDVSQGIGAGVISRGRRVPGASGLTGELGHITVDLAGTQCACGNRGCLETCASESVFLKKVGERVGSDLTLDEVIRLVNERKIGVDKELNATLEYLSIGIATLINLLNPEAVFLHGGIFDVAEDAVDRIKALVAQRTLKPLAAECTIRRSKASKIAGAVAAILERHFEAVGPKLEA